MDRGLCLWLNVRIIGPIDINNYRWLYMSCQCIVIGVYRNENVCQIFP